MRSPSWLLSLGLLAACAAPAPTPPPSAPPLRVVATFSVMGDWVRQVAGERVDLLTLVGVNGDAHVFEPTPADSVALARAELVCEIGLGFEGWLEELVQASGSSARRLVVGDRIQPRRASAADRSHSHHHGHDHGELDPHLWHDVTNARAAVEAIRDTLAELDPPHAEEYRARAERYLGELAELDRWVVAQVATLPTARRKLVTSHDTFGYFAERYGFTVVGSALPLSTEAADPSARQFARLVRQIRATGVPAIFAETMHDGRLVARLAAEAGVRVAPPLYTDALGPAGSPGATYVGMIRHNVEILVRELGAP
jgi:zinc/manganese transport system substrate-binding protein